MTKLSNAQLFGIGAAIGGVTALGFGLYARYVLIPGLFSSMGQQPQPTAANPQIMNPPAPTIPPVQAEVQPTVSS